MAAEEQIWPRDAEEELVFAMDVGTTQSAVCIAHCVPGAVPKYRVVQHWPSSPTNSKIPTVIVFDPNGEALAFGAEAYEDRYADDIIDGNLHLAKWFKLHLHPAVMSPPPYIDGTPGAEDEAKRLSHNITDSGGAAFEVPPLPPGVTVKNWYLDNTPDGSMIWEKLGGKVKIVLAHPNGWGPPEQGVLRSAVVDAGLIRASAKEERLHLVTEAEASVHFGVMHASNDNNPDGWLGQGSCFAVVDAGGSTVDTRAMEQIIRDKLKPSERYGTDEYVSILIDLFDQKTKLTFDEVDAPQVIKFGMAGDMDRDVGIAKGRLTLAGAEVEAAFAPCVETILKSIQTQIKGLHVTHILLVGGFGESPYLKRRVREVYEKKDIRVVTADEPTKKAVAEGAAIFYARKNVGARATRFEFGLATNRPYDPSLNVRRPCLVFNSQKRYYAGGWTRIVGNGIPVETDQLYKESFWVHKKPQDSLQFSTTIISFNGPDAMKAYSGWSQDDNGKFLPGFSECCTVTADLSPLAAITPIKKNQNGEKYRELDFEVGLYFGGTSLKACIVWNDGGLEIRSEATVIPAKFV
ncbi:hypothetical protein MNV49_006850 [Pseudohyphozyma bogoriensis]|nr:hypothetical protein MNV49_006850 [Pseudohyphozyma bogoriensis]